MLIPITFVIDLIYCIAAKLDEVIFRLQCKRKWDQTGNSTSHLCSLHVDKKKNAKHPNKEPLCMRDVVGQPDTLVCKPKQVRVARFSIVFYVVKSL